jgi:hypothetical protein
MREAQQALIAVFYENQRHENYYTRELSGTQVKFWYFFRHSGHTIRPINP